MLEELLDIFALGVIRPMKMISDFTEMCYSFLWCRFFFTPQQVATTNDTCASYARVTMDEDFSLILDVAIDNFHDLIRVSRMV
jgi:hypothetical protein